MYSRPVNEKLEEAIVNIARELTAQNWGTVKKQAGIEFICDIANLSHEEQVNLLLAATRKLGY